MTPSGSLHSSLSGFVAVVLAGVAETGHVTCVVFRRDSVAVEHPRLVFWRRFW